ncbi:MAG: tyrosine-type recombinase/integrase [Pseudomonadota bacterium]
MRNYRRDLENFAIWCSKEDVPFLPARPLDAAHHVNGLIEAYTFSTIRRRVSAIKFAHRMMDIPSPTDTSDVYLALRRAKRQKGRRPTQALGLTAELLHRILQACPDTLSGKRDAALISVGYDTLCRSEELCWMQVADVDLDAQTAYIARAKNDPFGDGRHAALSNRTVAHVRDWLSASKVKSGPIFRGLHTLEAGKSQLETSSIRRLVKAAARRAGLNDASLRLSGHSMRVGAAQDLMVAGYDTLAIMTAGGWKNAEIVARYVEKARLCRRDGFLFADPSRRPNAFSD